MASPPGVTSWGVPEDSLHYEWGSRGATGVIMFDISGFVETVLYAAVSRAG